MALPYDEVFDAIRDYLGYTDLTSGAWIDGEWDPADAVMVYENDTDGPPPGEPKLWVEVVLDTALYGQETIGADDGNENQNRCDEVGTLWFHVFAPRGTGSREARRVAKGLANLFRGQRLLGDDLEFMDADMGAGDPGEENGNYYLLSVNIDWRRTEAN